MTEVFQEACLLVSEYTFRCSIATTLFLFIIRWVKGVYDIDDFSHAVGAAAVGGGMFGIVSYVLRLVATLSFEKSLDTIYSVLGIITLPAALFFICRGYILVRDLIHHKNNLADLSTVVQNMAGQTKAIQELAERTEKEIRELTSFEERSGKERKNDTVEGSVKTAVEQIKKNMGKTPLAEQYESFCKEFYALLARNALDADLLVRMQEQYLPTLQKLSSHYVEMSDRAKDELLPELKKMLDTMQEILEKEKAELESLRIAELKVDVSVSRNLANMRGDVAGFEFKAE